MLRSTFFTLVSSSLSPPRSPTVRRYSSSAPTSAYDHLPFCRKRCHYCDFPIVALGSSPHHLDADPRISNYVHLLHEIAASAAPSDDHLPLEIMFVGGGMLLLVSPHLVSSILVALKSKFGVCCNAEVSIEMDHGMFDRARLEQLLELGVNRVSLRVQAFQEELLRACGRTHGLKEVLEAIEIVAECSGLQNWSMDLMSSLPHQTQDMWVESLRCAISARPAHVSVYDMQVEQGTKFGQL